MEWFLLGKRKNRSLYLAKQYEDSKIIGLVGSLGGISICSVGISSKFQIYAGGNSIKERMGKEKRHGGRYRLVQLL